MEAAGATTRSLHGRLVQAFEEAKQKASLEPSPDAPAFWLNLLRELHQNEAEAIREHSQQSLTRNEAPCLKGEEMAKRWKDKGNASYGAKDFNEALLCYTEVQLAEELNSLREPYSILLGYLLFATYER